MSKRTTQRIITALTATLLLATAVSTATARNLSTSNQGIRATWTSLEFEAAGATIRCKITLEGSFHARTIPKVVRTLIGAITKAMVKQDTCTGGRMSAFNGIERYNGGTPTNTLPWHLTYESFIGNLPAITGIRILLGGMRGFSRLRFGIEFEGGFCTGQYGASGDNITALAAREAGGAITSITPVEGLNRINVFRRDGGLLCPNGILRGTGSVMLLNTTTRITITLI